MDVFLLLLWLNEMQTIVWSFSLLYIYIFSFPQLVIFSLKTEFHGNFIFSITYLIFVSVFWVMQKLVSNFLANSKGGNSVL